ncbi:MAG TPA: DUF4175 family protein [Tepidisphaeraceae bacterium]|nr:DUF4175 family protein [Tepidisphaeraceae bacterium]
MPKSAVLPSLPPNLQEPMGRFVRRLRRWSLVGTAGAAIGIFLTWMLLACLADRFWRLTGHARLGLLILDGAAFLAVMWRAVRQWARRDVDWAAAAEEIDRRGATGDQRLQTVTSRLLGEKEYAGSPQLLETILRQVERDLAARPPARLVNKRRLMRPWGAALAAGLLVIALLPLQWLQLPRLMARFALPLAAIDPVTTTTLVVRPGDVTVIQGDPLTISVVATAMPRERAPDVRLSSDGRNWDVEDMRPRGSHTFSYSLASVDGDMQYSVSGGDASSRIFHVTTVRRPVVSAFRLFLRFPKYTKLQPASVISTTGEISVPMGTDVDLQLVCSEPLKDATFYLGQRALQLQKTIDPAVRAGTFHVDHSCALAVDMVTTSGVAGSGPAGMFLSAIPDRPPTVQMIQPSQDLRLAPFDVTDVKYVVGDDYGVASLELLASVNGRAARVFPIALRTDGRYELGAFAFDLTKLPDLQIGDLVRIQLRAQDGSGQAAESAPQRLLTIAPRSIDMQTYLRLGELRLAGRLAVGMADDLDAAVNASDSDTARQKLSDAQDQATQLEQTILQIIAHSDEANLSQAMARWGDELVNTESTIEDESPWLGSTATDRGRQKITRSSQRTRRLADNLQTLIDAQVAADVEKEWRDLQQAKSASAEYVERTRHDVDEQAAELKLTFASPLFLNGLKNRQAAAVSMLNQQGEVNFTKSAQEWIANLRTSAASVSPLEDRLAFAAKAEAVRVDGNAVRASDLELASQAAPVVQEEVQSPQAGNKLPPAADFPAAIGAVEKDWDWMRQSALGQGPNANSPDAKKIIAAAAEARKTLARWADFAPPPAPSDPVAMEKAEEAAIMRANADATTQPAIADNDQRAQLAEREAEQEEAEAKELDNLLQRQEELDQQTQSARADQLAQESQQQQQVADDLQRMPSEENQQEEDDALARIDAALKELQQMQGELNQAQQAADSGDQDQTDAAMPPVSPDVSRDLSANLKDAGDATTGAATAIDQQLTPALQQLRHSMLTQDAVGADRAAGQARGAIGNAETALRIARDGMTANHPLGAGGYFAGAAARNLAAGRGGRAAAHQEQVMATWAIRQARQNAARAANRNRLGQLPALAGILDDFPINLDLGGSGSGPGAAGESALPAWANLRNQDRPDVNVSQGQNDAAGYEDAIDAYFQALNKQRDQQGGDRQ